MISARWTYDGGRFSDRYYVAHRLMHEWHALWIGHSVHHSGEDYHLGTGLRQGVAQFTNWLCYIWLALLGFHPHTFSAHLQLNVMCVGEVDLVARRVGPSASARWSYGSARWT